MTFLNENQIIWGRYKTIALEAKVIDFSKYIPPPPKAKFQIDDILLVRDDGRYKMYHTKRWWPYVNQAGTVISYRNEPGSYCKYAVKFDDGAVLPIRSQFLYGPFKDKRAAEKYRDPSVMIDNKDLNLKIKILEDWEKKAGLETLARVLATEPYNYIWNDEPVIRNQDNKSTEFILASRGEFAFIRTNRTISKKLVGYTLIIPGNIRKRIFTNYSIFTSQGFDARVITIKEDTGVNITKDTFTGLSTQESRESYELSFKYHEKLRNKTTHAWSSQEFLEIAKPYITQTEGLYILTVPIIPVTSKYGLDWALVNNTLNYTPEYLRNCDVFDELIVNGDAAVYCYTNSLDKSPVTINGNLRIFSSQEITNFEHGSRVSGKVSGKVNENKFKEYIDKRNTRDAYKDHDLGDMIDF